MRQTILFAASVIIATVLAVPALAARKIVVPNDVRTIQGAIEKAQEDDTVFVANGVYRENLTLVDGVVLRGQDVDRTIVRGRRTKPVVRAARNAVITNLTIERGTVGILSENTNAIIEHNVIRNNARTGIQCIIALPHIRNNIIAGNGWSGVYCELISRAARSAIEHNIIAENGYSGVMLSNRSVVLVKNNTIFNNKEYGIFVAENAKRSRIIYNSIYGNRMPFNAYAVIDETNISKDPRLPSVSGARYSDISSMDSPLRGMGKDGTQIGLVSESVLRRSTRDVDKDGVPDNQDQCPDGAEDPDGFEDADGCPDYDNDFDGIYDQFDECPDDREDFDGYDDKDGCPDLDNDGDNVKDVDDKCPNKPETVNDYKDDDGCPDQKPR
ncbi:MAG: hypothetical protein GF418_03385 [Chitinivibrionales bacterium]|nr:hypothetical protein [Chitinivibrionales bacterium]MBD3394646.1 hypothetical protein [Chitinivibrionales bacterium]